VSASVEVARGYGCAEGMGQDGASGGEGWPSRGGGSALPSLLCSASCCACGKGEREREGRKEKGEKREKEKGRERKGKERRLRRDSRRRSGACGGFSEK